MITNEIYRGYTLFNSIFMYSDFEHYLIGVEMATVKKSLLEGAFIKIGWLWPCVECKPSKLIKQFWIVTTNGWTKLCLQATEHCT